MKIHLVAAAALLMPFLATGQESTCPTEENALVNCVGTQLSESAATACLNCVVDGIEGLGTPGSCAEAVGDICGIINTCSCGTCGDEIAEFFDCTAGFSDAGCPLDCGSSPPPPPPTFAPPPPSFAPPTTSPPTDDGGATSCPSEENALVNCVGTQLSESAATACLNCVVDGIEVLEPPTSCAEAVNDICGIIDSCSCGTCGDEIAEFFDCSAGFSDAGCPLDCGGSGPPPVPTAPSPFPPTSPTLFPPTDSGSPPISKLTTLAFAVIAAPLAIWA